MCRQSGFVGGTVWGRGGWVGNVVTECRRGAWDRRIEIERNLNRFSPHFAPSANFLHTSCICECDSVKSGNGLRTFSRKKGFAVSNVGQIEAVRMDWLGVFCSFGCALHCAAMPILLSSLPTLTTIQWLADPLFHQVVAVVCSVLVLKAIVPGFRLHRDQMVATLAGGGVVLLLIAAFLLPDSCCRHSWSQSNAIMPSLQAAAIGADSAPDSGASTVRIPAGQFVLVSKTASVDVPHSYGANALAGLSTTELSTTAGQEVTPTLGRPLFSAASLERALGSDIAEQLIHGQPFLSPLGGILLIAAHVINIRLRCCRRTGCSSAR
jgi:hypothetical protein